ncbi:hypothetical protein U9M48_005036 [Paspalum notatum var. saurae]|uniref:Cytochrome P450 n=1 Tax=Paspalum notatum var. saurae TaxID=547442 RepID=A0AAQ3PWS1_PASNO
MQGAAASDPMAVMGGSTSMVVVVSAALAVILVPWLWAALVRLVWQPHAVTRAFARQGVRGPPYRFFLGNTGEARAMRAAASGATLHRSSHDIVPLVMPHLQSYTRGRRATARGSTPVLSLGRYDMVKRVLSSDKAGGHFVKPVMTPALTAIMGAGLIMVEGHDWARHRRVVAPAFAADKVRMMAGAMASCAGEVVQSWAEEVAAAAGREGEVVEVGRCFRELTADVISRTAFGSSYRRGKEVFLAQRELLLVAMAAMDGVRVPGGQYVPTRANVRRWQLERKVRATLRGIVDERLAAAAAAAARESSQSPVEMGYGTDLLGLMLKANAPAGQSQRRRAVMTMDEIIDECKTFFFAGHETTAHLLTWSMFLLGTHPDWQRRLRDEVLRECGGGDALNLNKLELVTMVLYETLRLYGPISSIERQATADVELCGGVKVPKGTVLSLPFATLHRDEDAWGADAVCVVREPIQQFNPLRFRDAAHPSALMLAFSAGPRSCVGQDMAMLEAKATLALILRRFRFEVVPGYVHAPAGHLAPEVQVVLKLL